jgi:N-acetylmuramoyl-L-alanine amidase
MADPRTYHFKLPRYVGAPIPEPPFAWYPGAKAMEASVTSAREAKSDGRVRAFVIHATDGVSSKDAMSVMFGGTGSWHWLVPDENEPEHGRKVWACVREGRAAWHVRNSKFHPEVNGGARNCNYWSLGVEIVNTMDNDAYSEWQVQQTAALVRYAWSKYPDLVDVVSHAKLDPGRRSDPGKQFPWERFRALVLAPQPLVHDAPFAAVAPVRIVGPDGREIDCDPHTADGVTMAEARPLIEALGFDVEYPSDTPRTLRIRARG